MHGMTCSSSAGKANQGIPRNLPRRATRSGKATRPRQEELAGKTNQGTSRPGERQASGPDKITTAARRLPRQAATLCPRSSASTNVSLWGASPGARGGRLCSQRCVVACEADKIAIVANGGAPNGPLLHCSGDSDGHLMPLSPAVRVR